MKKAKILLSPRSRVKLTTDEMDQLRDFIDTEPTAYATIRVNTKVDPRTIKSLLANGFMSLAPSVRLRDFLKELKKIQV